MLSVEGDASAVGAVEIRIAVSRPPTHRSCRHGATGKLPRCTGSNRGRVPATAEPEPVPDEIRGPWSGELHTPYR